MFIKDKMSRFDFRMMFWSSCVSWQVVPPGLFLYDVITDAAFAQKISTAHLQQGQGEQIQMQKAATEHQASADRQEALDSMLCPRIGLKDIGYGTKPRCLDGTRTEIFISTARWVSDFSTSSPRILCITGVPGSGKSSIAASIAAECDQQGFLWAQYFFERSSDEITASAIFISLARQLTDERKRLESASVASSIHSTLKNDGTIANSPDVTQNQVDKLFVQPLILAAKVDLTQPVVIIIDALDECHRNHVYDLSQHLSHIIDGQELPSNVKNS